VNGKRIDSVEDALNLPEGELWRIAYQAHPMAYGFTPPPWVRVPATDRMTRWAAKLMLRNASSPRIYASRAQLVIAAIKAHPTRAALRGYSQEYRTYDPMQMPATPPKGPSGIGIPARRGCGGSCGGCC
jgi:hypothetical protein